MSFIRKVISLKTAVLFLAGCLTVPAAAQQEVSPDHFEMSPPKAAHSRKPSPQARRATTTANTQSAGKPPAPAAKAKKKVLAASVVKTNAGAGSNSR